MPAFRPDPRMVGVWEPRAGVLFPEAAIAAFLEVARRHGAEIPHPTRWRSRGNRTVRADTACATNAGIVRLSASCSRPERGSPGSSPISGLPLTVERLVQFWFDPAAIGSSSSPRGSQSRSGSTRRVASSTGSRCSTAASSSRSTTRARSPTPTGCVARVGPDEVEPLRALIRRYVPDADGPLAASAVCMYTNTPDDHFIIDRHPLHPAVLWSWTRVLGPRLRSSAHGRRDRLVTS